MLESESFFTDFYELRPPVASALMERWEEKAQALRSEEVPKDHLVLPLEMLDWLHIDKENSSVHADGTATSAPASMKASVGGGVLVESARFGNLTTDEELTEYSKAFAPLYVFGFVSFDHHIMRMSGVFCKLWTPFSHAAVCLLCL